MKRITALFLFVLIVLSNTVSMSAEIDDVSGLRNAFYYIVTFSDTIEDANFLEARVDAYCYEGQTGQGHAVASVEYDQVMLDSDIDMGTFVTVWAHAGDFQHPDHILYPVEAKRRSMWSVVELRWSDIDSAGNDAE